MHEQRQCRHLKGKPLRLAGPVQERRLYPLQRRQRILQPAHAEQHHTIGAVQLASLGKNLVRQSGRFLDGGDQPRGGVAGRGHVPIQRR